VRMRFVLSAYLCGTLFGVVASAYLTLLAQA
jgi:hypothetical protein